MIHKLLFAAIAAGTMLLGGCTAGMPNSSAPLESTGLTLELAATRQVQAVKEDVASVKVQVKFNNVTFREETFPVAANNAVLDLKNLPDGLAELNVAVFDGAGMQIGSGNDRTILQIGRRNFMRLYVYLDSKGKTELPLATPLELLR